MWKYRHCENLPFEQVSTSVNKFHDDAFHDRFLKRLFIMSLPVQLMGEELLHKLEQSVTARKTKN